MAGGEGGIPGLGVVGVGAGWLGRVEVEGLEVG